LMGLVTPIRLVLPASLCPLDILVGMLHFLVWSVRPHELLAWRLA
jgi:hypothetical protein